MTITEISQLHTLMQVAQACRVKRQTVYHWIHAGRNAPAGNVKLQATKIGGQFLIHPEHLAAFVRKCNEPAHCPNPSSAAKAKRREAAVAKAITERVG